MHSDNDKISHDQEMVSGEVHEERGGKKEVHEARESDERACGARAGCNGVHKAKESDDGPLEGGEDGNSVREVRESNNEVKESGNEACERRAMVNGNDIHMKMASSDRKAGKDEANEGK